MSLTLAIATFGTQIQVGDGLSPQTFSLINAVGSITGPKSQLAEKETTAHSSLIPHRTWIPTLFDDGTLAFPIFYNPADTTHNLTAPFGLEYLYINRLIRAFRVVETDNAATRRQFQGFISSFGENYPVDGVLMRDVTIRITSAPAIA